MTNFIINDTVSDVVESTTSETASYPVAKCQMWYNLWCQIMMRIVRSKFGLTSESLFFKMIDIIPVWRQSRGLVAVPAKPILPSGCDQPWHFPGASGWTGWLPWWWKILSSNISWTICLCRRWWRRSTATWSGLSATSPPTPSLSQILGRWSAHTQKKLFVSYKYNTVRFRWSLWTK